MQQVHQNIDNRNKDARTSHCRNTGGFTIRSTTCELSSTKSKRSWTILKHFLNGTNVFSSHAFMRLLPVFFTFSSVNETKVLGAKVLTLTNPCFLPLGATGCEWDIGHEDDGGTGSGDGAPWGRAAVRQVQRDEASLPGHRRARPGAALPWDGRRHHSLAGRRLSYWWRQGRQGGPGIQAS